MNGMDEFFTSKLQYGVDLATSLSIVTAALFYIFNNFIQNKKNIGEERERERVSRLIILQQEFSSLIEKYFSVITNRQSQEEIKHTLINIHSHIRSKTWSDFVMLAKAEDIKSVEKILQEFQSTVQEINKNGSFNAQELATSMIELEKSMMIQIRQLMNPEKQNDSTELIKEYSKKKYFS